jgi:transposase
MTSIAHSARRTAVKARNSGLLEALTRAGFVGYGLLHLAVGWLALQIAFGRADQEGSQSGAFQLLAHQPLGRPLLVVVAVGLLAMAVWQALEAAVGHHDQTGGRRVAERVFSAARTVVYALLAWTAFTVHLAHPLGIKGFSYRRVKNDERDAADLADLLRMGRLPEAWIAPPQVRGLREAVRHRAKLVALRSGLKAQVHAVLAKQGVKVAMSDLFGVGGLRMLDELSLDAPFNARVASLRRLIDAFTFEIDILAKRSGAELRAHPGFRAIQAIHGVGPVLAAVFVAEIGDVARFSRPQQLCSWAGLTPRHRESDTKVHRGRITKQGNPLVRWAAVEAVQGLGQRAGAIGRARVRVGERRGANIGKVAAARKLLTLVYWGLRDGHIRCLARPA